MKSLQDWLFSIQWPPWRIYWGFVTVFYLTNLLAKYYPLWGSFVLGISSGAICVWVYTSGVRQGEVDTVRFYIQEKLLKERE